jgi:ferredoxin
MTRHAFEREDTVTLRVDPTACTGHGQCAEMLPEMISLDEWGYPVITDSPVPTAVVREARRAAAACPALALRLTVRTRMT